MSASHVYLSPSPYYMYMYNGQMAQGKCTIHVYICLKPLVTPANFDGRVSTVSTTCTFHLWIEYMYLPPDPFQCHRVRRFGLLLLCLHYME